MFTFVRKQQNYAEFMWNRMLLSVWNGETRREKNSHLSNFSCVCDKIIATIQLGDSIYCHSENSLHRIFRSPAYEPIKYQWNIVYHSRTHIKILAKKIRSGIFSGPNFGFFFNFKLFLLLSTFDAMKNTFFCCSSCNCLMTMTINVKQ